MHLKVIIMLFGIQCLSQAVEDWKKTLQAQPGPFKPCSNHGVLLLSTKFDLFVRKGRPASACRGKRLQANSMTFQNLQKQNTTPHWCAHDCLSVYGCCSTQISYPPPRLTTSSCRRLDIELNSKLTSCLGYIGAVTGAWGGGGVTAWINEAAATTRMRSVETTRRAEMRFRDQH